MMQEQEQAAALNRLTEEVGKLAAGVARIADRYDADEARRNELGADIHSGQCEARTKQGGRCKSDVLPGHSLCKAHARAAAEEQKAPQEPPPEDPHSGQCESETKRGGRCLANALPGGTLCRMHARAAARATDGIEDPKPKPNAKRRPLRRGARR